MKLLTKMRYFTTVGVAGALALIALQWADDNSGVAQAAPPASADRIDIAHFDKKGHLVRPSDLEQWVFMGSSLGMGYNEADFDASNPGMFQIALMEPAAYRYFMEYQDYAEGTMFALNFYGSKQRLSTNRSGFVMGELLGSEIHMLDSARFKDGHNFYSFDMDSDTAKVMPDGNGCVTCHDENAAYKATFAQFYPPIRHLLPEGVLERSLEHGTARLE